MDSGARTTVATLHALEPLAEGRALTLGEEAAHHLRVIRASVGDAVALRDGYGGSAVGTLVKLARSTATVDVDDVVRLDAPPAVHLLAPVADRDRMLWLAEKATELGLTSWRPVMWRRSKSVSPRGEGPMFQQKLRARMTSALLQSQGAWLPETFPDATVERAVAAAPEGTRLLLDVNGAPILSVSAQEPVSIAVGPEGGIEDGEKEAFVGEGFVPVSLGATRLRFETAAIGGLSIVRAALALNQQPAAGGE
ncbi:16S rRNA (uracil(1498)-N(3))-methyltransferase [soil metagenome]